jgi:trimethylamine:corrinoid methyltransferase-like protein
LMDRQRHDRWMELGSHDMTTRANAKARALLTEHTLTPLPADAEQVITETLQQRALRPA